MTPVERVAALPGCGLAILHMHRLAAEHPQWAASAFDLLNCIPQLGLSEKGVQAFITDVAQGDEIAGWQVQWLANWLSLRRRLDVERARGKPDSVLQPLVQELKSLFRRFPGEQT